MGIDMDTKRYTESQVLLGLREVWQDCTGNDALFDGDTRIDTYMKSDGSWDELDLLDIVYRIESFFGFSCSHKEWTDFFGFNLAERSPVEWERSVAPNLTFGALARFIADRAPAMAAFEPMIILDQPCLPAGVFIAFQCVADKTLRKQIRFAPSDRIIDFIHGHDLDHFWSQLRWMTEHAIPELPRFWREVTSTVGCLGALAVIASLFESWATTNPVWFLSSILIAAMSCSLAQIYKRIANPLPSNIVTFRDLAMLVARHRSDCE